MDTDFDKYLNKCLDRGLDKGLNKDLDKGLNKDLGKDLDKDLGKDLDKDLDKELVQGIPELADKKKTTLMTSRALKQNMSKQFLEVQKGNPELADKKKTTFMTSRASHHMNWIKGDVTELDWNEGLISEDESNQRLIIIFVGMASVLMIVTNVLLFKYSKVSNKQEVWKKCRGENNSTKEQ